ncbi:hypothetical protein PAPHI01_0387 [Pancytospora philotis]|nr:hypothetical protein PAPHI01_0361 [Pancytospora philotis]KAI4291113.1 hypothetical protein PAPHI01_0387 [Pancytospora philotis]
MLVFCLVSVLRLVRSFPLEANTNAYETFASPLDHKNFGLKEQFPLNVLEVRELGPLCRCCILFTESGKAEENVDAELQDMSAWDREIYVITTVLGVQNPRDVLDKLMNASGFASRYLLKKLFSQVYLEHLGDHLKDLDAGNPAHKLSSLLSADKLEPKLQQIKGMLVKTESSDFAMSLLQYFKTAGESNDSFDYAIYTLGRQLCGRPADYSEYTSLIHHWLPRNADSIPMIPFVCDYLRVVLLPKFVPLEKQRHIKSVVMGLVASRDEIEYIKLLDAFDNDLSIKNQMTKLLTSPDERDISPQFIRNYTAYYKIDSKDTYDTASLNFWRLYLKTPADFVGSGDLWSEERVYFNKIGHMWLRYFFDELLRGDKKLKLNRADAIGKYVNMLDFDTFITISKVRTCILYDPLIDLMLEPLNEVQVEVYRARLQELKIENGGDAMLIKHCDRMLHKLNYLSACAQNKNSGAQHTPDIQQAPQKNGSSEHTGVAQNAAGNASARIPKPRGRKRRLRTNNFEEQLN